jgi:tetratricopeptide (TPR) repeat protein
LERGLEALSHLPQNHVTLEQAVDLRLALRSALLPSGNLGRILEYLREAESFAVAINDPRRLGQLAYFLSRHFHLMGAYDQAIAAGQRALELATASGDGILHAQAHNFLGLAYLAQGDYQQAIAYLGQIVASLDGAQRYERFGWVILPAVISRVWLAWCHAELGTFAEGRALGDEGLQIAQATNHLTSLTAAYRGAGLLCFRQGDLHKALSLLERAVDLCQETDFTVFSPRRLRPWGQRTP